jgi:formylmethanofuran dehydrogenase subunit E
MSEFETYVKKVGDYHGHICFGIAMGTKMTLAAMRHLELDPDVKNKNLIVYAEIDRCMTDAIQVITGCTLGHRTLKHVDYGKFAATFVNLTTGKAVRATIRESFEIKGSPEEVVDRMEKTPESQIVNIQKVEVNIPETDLPGFPKKRANCSVCGERIMDGREVCLKEQVLCRACANGKYYTEPDKKEKTKGQ